MKTIYKYQFEITDKFEIEMPAHAKILTVGIQGKTPCLWAIVDTKNRVEKRSFAVIGTGNPFWPVDFKYIGTISERVFIWHIFEVNL